MFWKNRYLENTIFRISNALCLKPRIRKVGKRPEMGLQLQLQSPHPIHSYLSPSPLPGTVLSAKLLEATWRNKTLTYWEMCYCVRGIERANLKGYQHGGKGESVSLAEHTCDIESKDTG